MYSLQQHESLATMRVVYQPRVIVAQLVLVLGLAAVASNETMPRDG